MDITELYAPMTTFDRYLKFWTSLTTFLARLYRSRLITIAAIRGQSPAAGCIIALCCDYRLWTSDTPSARMGLNEVAIGIPVPEFWAKLLVKVVGSGGRSDKMLLFGHTWDATTALNYGLVDALWPKNSILDASMRLLESLLKISDPGRRIVKERLREAFGRAWEAQGAQEATRCMEIIVLGRDCQGFGSGVASLKPRQDQVKALGQALMKYPFACPKSSLAHCRCSIHCSHLYGKIELKSLRLRAHQLP